MAKSYLPLVTIITATYNAEKYLEQSILSVLNQTYNNIEYIIIDGNSYDNTLKIIEKYRNKISYVITEPDEGIYDAWNKGLKLANGDWIAFLGADDEYLFDAIYNYVEYLSTIDINNVEYISSKVQLVNNSTILDVIGKPWIWNSFRLYMTVAHVGSLHSNSFFKKYGMYNLDYKIAGDYEMLLRANNNLKAAYLDKLTVNMQIGGQSNQKIRSIWETHKAVMQTGYTSILEGYLWLFKRIIHWHFSKL